MKDHKFTSIALDFLEGVTPEEFVAGFQKEIQDLRDAGWIDLRIVHEQDYDWSEWKVTAYRPMSKRELGLAKAARTRATKKRKDKDLQELEEARRQYENLKAFFEERQ